MKLIEKCERDILHLQKMSTIWLQSKPALCTCINQAYHASKQTKQQEQHLHFMFDEAINITSQRHF